MRRQKPESFPIIAFIFAERNGFGAVMRRNDAGGRRMVHQIWDWTGERRYTMHLYITRETVDGWESHHFASMFHAVPRDLVNRALADAGFGAVRWVEPEESGYYQPLVLARF